jgi:peptidoglycan/xylan/chitin deacetylase (PgdA/CDA1 family)
MRIHPLRLRHELSRSAALALTLLAIDAGAATACPNNPDALGTARVLAVDAAAYPRVGRKHFAQTLPLAPKEVVLTFDDGPAAWTTPRVLEALKHECVRATFFLLGRNAAANPALAHRILADGHSIGYHTFSHPLLSHLAPAAAEAEIDRGIVAVDTAVYGQSGHAPASSFFRFPGFSSTPTLLDWLAQRGIVVFGADLWASDWNPMRPDGELHLVLQRLEASRGGILLLHDTVPQTAAMLPALLRALKNRGYRIVHVVAAPQKGYRPPGGPS